VPDLVAELSTDLKARSAGEAPDAPEVFVFVHGLPRFKKLRYEALPGLWIPALLYEPTQLTGKVPDAQRVICSGGRKGCVGEAPADGAQPFGEVTPSPCHVEVVAHALIPGRVGSIAARDRSRARLLA